MSVTHSDWEQQHERLSAYLDGELTSAERSTIEAHLSGCDECQRELAALRKTRDLLRALPAPALPRAFTLPEQPAPARRGAAPVWARPAQLVGGIAAMIGLGLLITTALPSFGVMHGAAGETSSVSAPSSYGAEHTAPSRPYPTPTSNGGAAPTASSSATHSYSPEFPQQPEQPFPVIPTTGGTLLVGGATALTLGSLARRRSRRAA